MDGWIEHDGKGIPVSPETQVIVRFRDGDEETPGMEISASYWVSGLPRLDNWIFQGHDADITHYRIIAPK